MIRKFKLFIASLFADTAGKYSKVDDYIISGVIIISTVEIIVSSFGGLSSGTIQFLNAVNIFSLIFFTIEVLLRIWCAGDVDPRYKGWRGKLKYCTSFWGLIDIMATFPYYLTLISPLPITVVNILRVLRIFRIFRFTPSFKIIVDAFNSKKSEIWMSVQLLSIITIILSLIMYYVEVAVQPEACSDSIVPILWSFMQYIGDPGGSSHFVPITVIGQIIASLVGILGIAIFAVPAGLLGSAFVEVIDEQRSNKEKQENAKNIIAAFRPKLCRITKYYNIPRYITLKNLQSLTGLSENDILESVAETNELRIDNLANTISSTDNPIDNLIVQYAPINRSYGSFIDRGSSITIVSTSGSNESAIGHFTYNLAKIGGFNYVSKEIEPNRITPYSYYNIGLVSSLKKCENVDEFLNDIHSLAKDEKSWVIFMISSSGQDEPHFPIDLHFNYGDTLGNNTLENQKLAISDVESFDNMYNELDAMLDKNYGHPVGRQDYYRLGNKNICWQYHKEDGDPNAFAIRISYSTTCWDIKALEVATRMAESFNKHFENTKAKGIDTAPMKVRTSGFDL